MSANGMVRPCSWNYGDRITVTVHSIERSARSVVAHPNPLPLEVGYIRLRQYEMPNSGKPELGEEGADRPRGELNG
jgi:hypothetical protein